MIIETERLSLRELEPTKDAEFIYELLNTTKFLKYIGDRGVRSVADASRFIVDRYRESYRLYGFGLYLVELKDQGISIGMCGFVKRESLSYPDLGFAFLPEFERRGYGYESAAAVLEYGANVIGLNQIMAITSPDNHVSGKLLVKLGFKFEKLMEMPSKEKVMLYGRICE